MTKEDLARIIGVDEWMPAKPESSDGLDSVRDGLVGIRRDLERTDGHVNDALQDIQELRSILARIEESTERAMINILAMREELMGVQK